MHIVFAIVAVLLCFILVVGVHEAGHALAAHFFKVRIKRISIGFGRPLFKWHSQSGLEWVWGAWPLGGYVLLLNSRIMQVAPKAYESCFDKKPLWVRFIILASGGLANVLIAWFALTGYFLMGYQQTTPMVSGVSKSSIAFRAGVQSGDRILQVAGKPVISWRDAAMQLLMQVGEDRIPVMLENHSGSTRQTHINLSRWSDMRPGKPFLSGLGIQPERSKQYRETVPGMSIFKASMASVYTLAQLSLFFMVILKKLILGIIPLSLLLGPLGFFKAIMVSFFEGMAVFLYFIGHLSFAVGLINLLPVPGLDGGSIVYGIVEKFRGKPMSVALEVLLYRLALIAFCVLMVQLLVNDLERYLQ